METEISKALIMSLKRIYETEENLLSYINYYKSLIKWIKEHLKFFWSSN